MVIGLFVLQTWLVIYAPGQTTWQMIILISSQLALLGLILYNHAVPGARLFALGIALNLLVMVANGGWMPVTTETYRFVHPNNDLTLYTKPPSSKNIILPRSDTKFWYLSDVIRLNLLWQRTAVSLGDILLVGGVGQLIWQGTARKQERQPLEQPIERIT
jgi:hypothetical protein